MAINGDRDLVWFGIVTFEAAVEPLDEHILLEGKRLAKEAGMTQERVDELIWKIVAS